MADSKKNFQEIKCRTEKLSKTLKHRTEFLMAYEKANPQFLNHSLEKIVFLKPEIETLRVIYGHPAFQSCPAVKERLSRLTKGENCLVFSEKKRDTSSLLEEFYYHQEVPVEVNGEDIKQILSMIEGIKIGVYQPPFDRPQLVIQYFDLKRDELFGRECYFLEMNLIKRQPMIRG